MEVKYGTVYVGYQDQENCSIYSRFITKIHLLTILKAQVYL